MNVQFHSNATGFPDTIEWQWQGSPTGMLWENLSDGDVYSGVNTKDLTVSVVDDTLNGWWYRAVANNVYLTATSGSAQLTITDGT